MNNLMKTLGLTALLSLSALTLQGCSSGLEPDTFSVELNEMDYGSRNPPAVITIRSNIADPIEVTNVTVNNGQCSYMGHDTRFNFPLHFQMGQIFRENAAPPSNPMGIRIDSKRRKKLMQKRLAMGHKQDDHEQNYGQTLQ